MRKVIALLGLCLLMATACPSNKPELPSKPHQGSGTTDPKENTPDMSKYTMYKLQSSRIKYLYKLKGKGTPGLELSEYEQYFGNKLNDSAPLSLFLSKDSLIVKRPFGIMEKYKISFKDDEIYIHHGYNSYGDQKYSCGHKTKANEIVLKKIFYKVQSTNNSRTIVIRGQDYGTQPIFHHIEFDEGGFGAVMKVEYLFHLK